jgi:hypothetical protein
MIISLVMRFPKFNPTLLDMLDVGKGQWGEPAFGGRKNCILDGQKK